MLKFVELNLSGQLDNGHKNDCYNENDCVRIMRKRRHDVLQVALVRIKAFTP